MSFRLIKKQRQKISVVGAGNIGISCAVDISQNKNLDIYLYTSKADIIDNELFMIDLENKKTLKGQNIHITFNEKEAFENAELIIITLPSFLISDFIRQIEKFAPKAILFSPGFGSKELNCKSLLQKGCSIFGFDRSPYIARLISSNKVQAMKKKTIRIGCLGDKKDDYYNWLTEIFRIECLPVKNYLTITFTPSNPILHTARLYSVFKYANSLTIIDKRIKFYADWTDESSEVLFAMDSELQQICYAFPNINLSGVILNSDHYAAKTPKELTKKIQSINSWSSIGLPLTTRNNLNFIDTESRYFREDFPFGLCILKGYAEITKVKTPMMDVVLKWYQHLSGKKYFNSQGLYIGEDLKQTGIPQNYGLNDIKSVEKFYLTDFFGNE